RRGSSRRQMESESSRVSNEYRRAVAFNRALAKAGGVALFVALTAAASRIKVFLPFSPVPMTMQPMAVLLAGAVLGPLLRAPRPPPVPPPWAPRAPRGTA